MSEFTITNENFKIGKYDISKFNGSMYIPIKVKGYWSSDAVQIRVHKYFGDEFTVEVSHSAGGVEKGADCVETEAYFGEALITACKLAKHLRSRQAEFEDAYQKYIEMRRLEREKIEAERQAKFDADTFIDRKETESIIQMMRQEALDTSRSKRYIFRKRGKEDTFVIQALVHNVNVAFYEIVGTGRRKEKHALSRKAAFEKIFGCGEVLWEELI